MLSRDWERTTEQRVIVLDDDDDDDDDDLYRRDGYICPRCDEIQRRQHHSSRTKRWSDSMMRKT